jgi:hypothetical protein
MCGILAYLSRSIPTRDTISKIRDHFNKIKPRGPDQSRLILHANHLILGFHRAALSGTASQPFVDDNIIFICNGDIFNHSKLAKSINYTNKSGTDCEIIGPLYKKYGFHKMCQKLDGVFSIILFDGNTGELWIGRDPIGIRPLYISRSGSYPTINKLKLASIPTFSNMEEFTPGTISCYQCLEIPPSNDFDILEKIRNQPFYLPRNRPNYSLSSADTNLLLNRIIRQSFEKQGADTTHNGTHTAETALLILNNPPSFIDNLAISILASLKKPRKLRVFSPHTSVNTHTSTNTHTSVKTPTSVITHTIDNIAQIREIAPDVRVLITTGPPNTTQFITSNSIQKSNLHEYIDNIEMAGFVLRIPTLDPDIIDIVLSIPKKNRVDSTIHSAFKFS